MNKKLYEPFRTFITSQYPWRVMRKKKVETEEKRNKKIYKMEKCKILE